MAKWVRFPMFFEVCAYQEVELPDTVDSNDEEAVRQYIEDSWDDIPLPDESTWDYVSGTCWPDEGADIRVIDG